MLSIGFFSVTIIVIMAYPLLFPKTEMYYYNRISTVRDESPIFELGISGLSFLLITLLLAINSNYTWLLYVFAGLTLDRLIPVCILFYRRNELVPSGTKYNLIPTNLTGWIFAISFGLFAFIAVNTSWDYIREFSLYWNEIQISAVLLGFWILIYQFFKTTSTISTPNKILNGIDDIIDRYVYGDISKEYAMEELMCLRYGSSVNQIARSDRQYLFYALRNLESSNNRLEFIEKTIDDGEMTEQLFEEFADYLEKEFTRLGDVILKGKNLVKWLNKIIKIPNNAWDSDEYRSLQSFTMSGVDKIEIQMNKTHTTFQKFIEYGQQLLKEKKEYALQLEKYALQLEEYARENNIEIQKRPKNV